MLSNGQGREQPDYSGDAAKVHVLAAYGQDSFYHYGAVFAALRILAAFRERQNRPEIWVYTDRRDLFSGYPVSVIDLSPAKISDWSLDGRYHFRIKNRVLVDALARGCSYLLFLDSDMVVKDRTDKDFITIMKGHAVLHIEEGKACRINAAYHGLQDICFKVGSEVFQLSGAETMWRSSVIGVSSAMIEAVNQADELICQMVGRVAAHTLEQFALGVALSRVTKIHASKTRFIDYSDYYDKAIAKERLSMFFKRFGSSNVEAQIDASQTLRPTSSIERFKLKRGLTRRRPQDFQFIH